MLLTKRVILFVGLLLQFLPFIGFAQTNTPVKKSFSFTVNENSTTSAGIYTTDGVLIRTLWNGEQYNAGDYTESWDGLDDSGRVVTIGNYKVKLLSNNVKGTWEGVVGNTTDGQKGFFDVVHSMAFNSSFGYLAAGYEEQQPVAYKFSLSNNQKITNIGLKGATTKFVTADENYVYWGASDGDRHWVYITNVNDDKPYISANSKTVSVYNSPNCKGAIDVFHSDFGSANAKAPITGLAVQQVGSFLAVSHGGLNILNILNKTTGALISSVNMPNPRGLSVDDQDNLWVISENNRIAKYSINADGTLSKILLSIFGVDNPVAIAAKGSKILVSDLGPQQVKCFNSTTGALISTLGTAGGYSNGPAVTNYKFYWKDNRYSYYGTFLSFQKDGTFWVGDGGQINQAYGNCRYMHYNASFNYIDKIQYMPAFYSCVVDQNNPLRIFVDYLEFRTNYNGLARDNWDFKNNWGYNVTLSLDEKFTRFKGLNTLSNGRTYAAIGGGIMSVVELVPESGIRYTGLTVGINSQIYPDGSLYTKYEAKTGLPSPWFKQSLLGFNALNNPIYSIPSIVETTPIITNQDPVFTGNLQTLTSGEKTKSGIFVSFDGNTPGKDDQNGNFKSSDLASFTGSGYHLGGVKNGKWMWKTAMITHPEYSGPYPRDGSFDIGNGVNQYSGSKALVCDDIIIWGYHGEFWKGGQTNMWNIVMDNGLLINQLGTYAQGQAVDGMAGNSFSANLVKVNGDIFLYTNDESYHSGLHRWKISGLSTIQVQTLEFLPQFIQIDEGVDLMEGLPFKSVLQTNTNGWTRYPENENYTNLYDNYWSVKTSVQTTQKGSGRDVFGLFRSSLGDASINRDLGNNIGLSSWSINGKLSFDRDNGNNGIDGGVHLDILDNTGKIIIRIGEERKYVNENDITRIIWANNKQIVALPELELLNEISIFQKLKITVIGDTITIAYGKYKPITAKVFEPGANYRAPKTLRLNFHSDRSNYTRAICVSDLKFKKNFLTYISNSVPDAQCSGTGKIFWEYWRNISGTSIKNIPVNIKAEGGQYLSSFSAPKYFDNNYGARVRGYICVPRTGEYTFFIASDDDGELWLSSDVDPARKSRIAYVSGYSGEGQYNKFPSQKSVAINLKAGEKYYIEALMKEDAGGDHLSVAWQLPDGTMEAPIPGSRLIPYSDAAPVSAPLVEPTISIASPLSNSTFTTNSVNISSAVSDPSGLISRVEFYAGTSKIGEKAAAPYSFSWSNVANGSYSITARVITNRGASINSGSVNVTVNVPVNVPVSCQGAGNIIWEYWLNVPGSKVSDIPLNRAPDGTASITSLSTFKYFGENYGSRVGGYVCVPQTGNYTFYIATDDDGELWLSPDANPLNKQRIAYVSGWTEPGQYNKFPSQKSVAINLKAGEKYYIEALQKEGAGGDHLSVAWQLPDGTMEAPIPGSRLIPYSDTAPVSAPLVAPTISIASPLSNSTFTTNSINISTAVSDPSGLISRVEFYAGTSKIGEKAGAPYSFSWSNVANGSYSLTARVITNRGAIVNSAAVNVNVNVAVSCQGAGNIIWEYWLNVPGSKVSDIPLNRAPDGTASIKSLSTFKYFGENYGSRVRGYVCVPQTGNYTFYIATDDDGELWLSPDANPLNKQRIAYVSGWTEPGQYNKFPSQKSVAINLKAGEKYYIEALMKEATGGDHLSVAWQLPDGTMEAPIPGSRLIPYSDTAPVSAPLVAPTISIASPLSNSTFTTNSINISTAVSDPSGLISRVEFYAGTSKIGEKAGAPYSFSWSNVANGSYSLTARVITNRGAIVNSAAVNVNVNVAVSCQGAGNIIWEYWLNVPGSKVSDIPLNRAPDGTASIKSLSTFKYFGENYGSRVRGYVCVPQTGNYTFYIATDDDGELWLSPDANPLNKKRIAFVSGWTEPGQYNKFPSQKSVAINLKAGEKYYIEALMKEATGGDHLSVAWQLPDGTMEAPIPGSSLIPFTNQSATTYARGIPASTPAKGAAAKGIDKANYIQDVQLTVKAFPNPFANQLNIDCSVPSRGAYSLQLYNMQGVLIKTIFNGTMNAGKARYTLSGLSLSSGMYVLRLSSGKTIINTQVSLIK